MRIKVQKILFDLSLLCDKICILIDARGDSKTGKCGNSVTLFHQFNT